MLKWMENVCTIGASELGVAVFNIGWVLNKQAGA